MGNEEKKLCHVIMYQKKSVSGDLASFLGKLPFF